MMLDGLKHRWWMLTDSEYRDSFSEMESDSYFRTDELSDLDVDIIIDDALDDMADADQADLWYGDWQEDDSPMYGTWVDEDDVDIDEAIHYALADQELDDFPDSYELDDDWDWD